MLNIVGETVALGPLSRNHLPAFFRWLNDFDVLRTTNQVRPMTMEALDDSFRESGKAADEVHFVIYERVTLRPIGSVNLTHIRGRTATFAIAIGEKDCWGKGVSPIVLRCSVAAPWWRDLPPYRVRRSPS